MRAVVDTNIVVRSALKPHGTVGPIVDRLRQGAYTLIYSSAALAEIAEVLRRPRITRRLLTADETIASIEQLIVEKGELVVPTRRIAACRDPKDDKFLEAAVAGKADVIVSGDEDLVVLSPFEGITIVSPAAFLTMLERTGPS